MSGALLWCKSNFSFLEGASHPEELVEAAHQLGYSAIAITDRDGVYGVVRAHEKAKELGIKLIIGAEVTLGDGGTIVLLAMTRRGYGSLCRLLTVGRMRCEKGRSEVSRAEVAQHAEDLVALWRLDGPHEDLQAAFGDRLYGMVARHHRPEDVDTEAAQRERAAILGVPLVAAPEILYHHVERRPLQDVVTCIRNGVSLPEAGRLLKSNDTHAVMTKLQLERRYADCLPIGCTMNRRRGERGQQLVAPRGSRRRRLRSSAVAGEVATELRALSGTTCGRFLQTRKVMMTWTDFERTSVVNLDGSHAERNPYAVPRLVVALEEDGRWRGFAVTETHPVLEFAEPAEGRSQAKRALVSAILHSLKEDAARPGHAHLIAVQPHLEALHALVF